MICRMLYQFILNSIIIFLILLIAARCNIESQDNKVYLCWKWASNAKLDNGISTSKGKHIDLSRADWPVRQIRRRRSARPFVDMYVSASVAELLCCFRLANWPEPDTWTCQSALGHNGLFTYFYVHVCICVLPVVKSLKKTLAMLTRGKVNRVYLKKSNFVSQ